ncbi:hypothetical protein ACLKMH_08450 [Psychromonas sp. KJ10-10]|uniref:hypothetical protein n=1 Tax=Psychromonas sp. KJ10-10 TaxID=3391823 RepID=UPI0039B6035B
MKTLFFTVMIFLTACVSSTNLTNNDYRGVVIGMPVDKALSLLPHFLIDREEDSDCYYLHHPEENTDLYIMIIDDTVVRFDVFDKQANIFTQNNIGIGSSKQDVLKTYQKVKSQPHEYLGEAGEYLEVTLPSGNGLIFETEFDVVGQYRLGRYPEVQYIEGCL